MHRLIQIFLGGMIALFFSGIGFWLTLAPNDVSAEQNRLVVFEASLSRGCPYCQEGSEAINQLADEYAAANQPVLFLEYNADCNGCYFGREDRFSRSGADFLLPMVIIDSGQQSSSRPADYYTTYKSMVDTALARTAVPQVETEVKSRRTTGYIGYDLEFTVTVTNTSGINLGIANNAMLHAVVYEAGQDEAGLTANYVWGSAYDAISPEMAVGESRTFTLTVESLSSLLNWDHLASIIMVDYRPGGSTGPADMLQAIKIPGASFTVSQQATPDPVQPGAPLAYTIRLVNTGGMDLHATITDTLPTNVTYTGPALVWTPTITAPGGVWEQTFNVTVADDYTGPLVNMLEVTTDEGVHGVFTHLTNGNKIHLPLINR